MTQKVFQLLFSVIRSSYRISLTASNFRFTSEAAEQEGMTESVGIPKIPAPPTVADITNTSAVVTWVLPGNYLLKDMATPFS